MPDLKTKQVVAPAIKTADLPDDVVKAAEGKDIDRWFYATVEAPDREKDVVRVAGIDLKEYAQNGPLKFISGHRRAPGPDGRLPVCGKAVEWVKTKHKSLGFPALAVGIKFAPNDLGKEMKELYDGEFLTDVSIGFEPVKATPLKHGGFDYEESAIGELSACITGMNQYAGVLRALEAEVEQNEVRVPFPQDIWKAAEYVALIDALKTIGDRLAEMNKQLTDRIDNLEDTLSSLPQSSASQDDRKEPKSKKVDLDKLAAYLKL